MFQYLLIIYNIKWRNITLDVTNGWYFRTWRSWVPSIMQVAKSNWVCLLFSLCSIPLEDFEMHRSAEADTSYNPHYHNRNRVFHVKHHSNEMKNCPLLVPIIKVEILASIYQSHFGILFMLYTQKMTLDDFAWLQMTLDDTRWLYMILNYS